jgi:mRNA-degrading endonuclease toxin of MazEF toxin-antitoxin module
MSGGLHNLRMNGRRRLAGRRRSAPWVVLVVAPAMFLASIGLTLVVAFTHENRSAGIEALLGSGEE